MYTNIMECQKSLGLQSTCQADYIIADSFLLEGNFTDLYMFSNELKIVQKDKIKVIPMQFGLTFVLIENQYRQPVGLQFCFGEEKITLQRDFWPRANEWERNLMGKITRKDFHQFFKPLKKIGKGNFATVYLAEDLKNHRTVAVKAFMKEVAYKGDGKRGIENQINIMRNINSPNITQLYGVYETKNSLYFSTEFAQGCTLETFLRRTKNISTDVRRKIVGGLLNGLKELARQRIVHRDIKPENIIVSEDYEQIKIVDFGLATFIDQPTYIFVRCGTPGFVAPEILKIRDVNTARLGVESDMFSLGAIYYNLIYGKPLFSGKNQNEVLTQNRECKIKLSQKQTMAYGQFQLLCNMLQIDPKTRITPQQALKSSFFRQTKDQLSRALQPIDNSSQSWYYEEKRSNILL